MNIFKKIYWWYWVKKADKLEQLIADSDYPVLTDEEREQRWIRLCKKIKEETGDDLLQL